MLKAGSGNLARLLLHHINFMARKVDHFQRFRTRLNDPEIPEIFEQIGEKLLDIVAAVEKLLQAGKERQRLPRQHGCRQLMQLAAVDHPQGFQDVGVRDRFLPAADDLVQQAQAVAHAPARLPGDQFQALFTDRDVLLAADGRQVGGNRR